VTATPGKSVSSSHVIWAYDRIVWALHDEGLSVSAIRFHLANEHELFVGENAILSVLRFKRPGIAL
jgi:hypothetical protein